MSNESTNDLHLPDLSISGFRGIEQLEIPRLGRVTLLAGRNAVGKTTVLDAVRVYAARGRSSAMSALLQRRHELLSVRDEDDDAVTLPDYGTLFHRWNGSEAPSISIGPSSGDSPISIAMRPPRDRPDRQTNLLLDGLWLDGSDIWTIRVAYGENERFLPVAAPSRYGQHTVPRHLFMLMRRGFDDEWPPAIQCESLGPGLPLDEDVGRFWDNVAGTDDEDRSVDALQLLSDEEIRRIAVIGPLGRGRRVIVRLSNRSTPVSLKSLGDGAARFVGVALALANSRNGFLTIDEAENGIHFTALEGFWRMILRTAQENDVQVLATTHSWDCVKGFARAASKLGDVEGILVRLERDDDHLRAVEYSEEELEIVADQGIEVR